MLNYVLNNIIIKKLEWNSVLATSYFTYIRADPCMTYVCS